MRPGQLHILTRGLWTLAAFAGAPHLLAQSGGVASPESLVQHGREVWFRNTYGNEKYYAFLANHPDPARRFNIPFLLTLQTPRARRFDTWGLINDPDCRANPAGGLDICEDPRATGVIGFRQTPGPAGQLRIGVTCASCHAGFDPLHPPDNPNEPKWNNIHPTIGNQYGKFGEIFAAGLSPGDPRRLLFAAWPRGTVDTTLLFNDNILNPGVVTAFWEHRRRPTFDVGADAGGRKLRNGQGGEDDLGGDIAAERVYTNIGTCFAECSGPAIAASAPLDVAACRTRCPDYPPRQDLENLTAFLASIPRPRFPARPDDREQFRRGRTVFAQNCRTCHANQGEQRRVLSSDRVIPLAADPANATNACRALTTNWDEGKLWSQFSSAAHKERASLGQKGYRVMPLGGIWATAPFLHNQSIGAWAPAIANPEERAVVYRAAMRELLSPVRPAKVYRLPLEVGPFPAGTPLTQVFSRDPATNALLCADELENRGHYYGAFLPPQDKEALIYWLQYQ